MTLKDEVKNCISNIFRTETLMVMTRRQAAAQGQAPPAIYPLKGEHRLPENVVVEQPEDEGEDLILPNPVPLAPQQNALPVGQAPAPPADANLPAPPQAFVPFRPVQEPVRQPALPIQFPNPEMQRVQALPKDTVNIQHMINPLPIQINFTGKLPDQPLRFTETHPMQFPENMSNKQYPVDLDEDDIDLLRTRLPTQQELNSLIHALRSTVIHNYKLPIQLTEFVNMYKASPYFKHLYKYIDTGYSPYTGADDKRFRKEAEQYVISKRLMFKIVYKKSIKQPKLVLCVPEKAIPTLLYQYHDTVLACHQGITNTLLTLREKYFFPYMFDYIYEYISTCHRCQQSKEPNLEQAQNRFIKVPVGYKPFERMSMDIKTMPKNSLQQEYLLLCVCEVTLFTMAFALNNRKATHVLDVLYNRLFTLFGPPHVIITDKESAFTSQIADILFKRLNIQPYFVNPQNKGSNRTERYIQIIGNMMVKMLEGTGREWHKFVSACQYAMNTFVSRPTGYSPYEMVFITEPPTFHDFAVNLETYNLEKPAREFMIAQKEKFQQLRKWVAELQLREQQERKERDKHRSPVFFNKGDWVMYKRKHKSELKTGTRKFVRPWIGPARVQTVLDSDNYLISDWSGLVPPTVFNYKELKPYSFRIIDAQGQWITITNDEDLQRYGITHLMLGSSRPDRVQTDASQNDGLRKSIDQDHPSRECSHSIPSTKNNLHTE